MTCLECGRDETECICPGPNKGAQPERDDDDLDEAAIDEMLERIYDDDGE